MAKETRGETRGGRKAAGSAPGEVEVRALLRAIGGYALVADTARRIRFLNRSPTGTGLRRFVGKDFTELFAGEQRPLVRDAAAHVLAGGAPVELEARDVETQHWHWLRIVGILEADAVEGIALHALDIEERKRADAELAVFRAQLDREGAPPGKEAPGADGGAPRLERMADALPQLISYLDGDRRYRYNNLAYERWFRTSREVMRGRTLEEVVGTAAYEEIRTYVDAVLSGQAVTFETKVPYRDAGVRRVLARYVPDVTGQGEVRGFYAVVEDVTARREAELALRQREEELRQLQKMEALGRLAGGIAHDFANLLQTVITGCGAVLEFSQADSPVAAQIEQIRRVALRGTSMTRQLQLFSRVGELKAEALELDALIGDMGSLLGGLLSSSIELQVELGAGCRILADAGQIQQLLMNLAINAKDALAGGGLLRIETSREDITAEEAVRHGDLKPGPHAVLEIYDSGTGMDEETRARAFDPFFTTKEPGEGTGLGLSTVYGIVQQMDGHIEVESTPGRGTTFRLYLPVFVASEAAGV